MLKEILKAVKEAAAINLGIFMLGFMIMAGFGYGQDGEILGAISCICGAIIAATFVYNETQKTEALIYKDETEDSELDWAPILLQKAKGVFQPRLNILANNL